MITMYAHLLLTCLIEWKRILIDTRIKETPINTISQ